MAGNTIVRVDPGKSACLPNGTTLTVVKGATLGIGHPDMVQVRDDEGMPIVELTTSDLLKAAALSGTARGWLEKIIAVELEKGSTTAQAILEINGGYTSVYVPFDYVRGMG